ncbi:hypothetical protein BKA63DRAFT_509181 [Paraphoma chrysanthemicola]|nr:hypothetical protein BKA63DRAFT_509181 [Paraphoma chrysanthemicola]
MANANKVNDSFQAAFNTSIEQFRVKLKNDDLYREILQTRKIEEVYDITDKLQEEQSRTGRLRHLSKIEPFLEGLRGYASVIEVFMQAKPDVLALIWGPIKLLLQWADVLKQSMDAIVDTVAEIGDLIPEFRISSKVFGEKTAIRDVLLLFFRDILDFYVIALKFFSSPRLKFVFEALWPRQRNRIKIVVGHLQRHTHLLRNEVRLEHIQAEYEFRKKALELFDEAENSHRLQEYQSLRTSMATRKYEEKLQYLDDRSCQDAGLWLMKHIEFCSWIEKSPGSNSVLWLQGIPGSGKTHLAGKVVHEARKRGHSLFAFLTYTHTTSVSALSILHSLVFQLSADDPDLQSILCQSSGENFRHDIDTAKSVFKAVSSIAGALYITIDGLDEIESAPRCQILSILLQFASEIDGLRLLVSCRAEADISLLLKGKGSNIRINELNIEGIQSFITQRAFRWYNERNFIPEAQKDIECLLEPLAGKSKGMFLYAKIVLDTIEFLEPDEILEDLKILPETMDDAYGRILLRINQQPPIVREKARSIIGWIGVSPTPFTIHEIEQALLVQSQGIDGTAVVKSKYPVDRVCGPIIEVVDGYMQFVHFTVQEYFLSPLISTAIDPKVARLGLTACCITYLCQRHHDRDLEPATMSQLIFTGAYRLHDFAVLYWLSLVESVFSTYSFDAIPVELTNLLETLRAKRESSSDRELENPCVPHHMIQLRQSRPELATVLCNSIKFRASYGKSSLRTRASVACADHDPLDISLTSCYVHAQMETLLKSAQFTQRTVQDSLIRHYGERLFKCRYLFCTLRRHGFNSKASRNSHEKEHERPWICGVEGCEFENGGFLSRKMRDDHLERFHNHHDVLPNGDLEKPDEADLKNVCLDLVKADDVSSIRELAATGMLNEKGYTVDLIACAAQHASPEMMKILLNQGKGQDQDLVFNYDSPFRWLLLPEIVAGNNSEMLEYILQGSLEDWKKQTNYRNEATINRKFKDAKGASLFEVLAKGNDEMLGSLCRWVEKDVLSEETKPYLVSYPMVAATTGDVYREQILLGLWRKIPSQQWTKSYWKNALISVASSTRSIELAKFLINQGVPVDWRNSEAVPTPLVHAARHTSSEAAELVRLLVFNGAKTVVEMVKGNSQRIRRRVKQGMITENIQRSQIHVSELKGAQQISKWLGVSFDELVAQATKARGELESSDT